jgi:hypothetical protein
MLEGGAREMLRDDERLHFWRYFDLKSREMLDNRYLIANLIQCEAATARVVEPGALSGTFALQEQVIADILKSVAEKKALEAAPRSVDPVQQTIATAIQGYLNHPSVDRAEAIELIRFLNQPMLNVQLRELRAALRSFGAAGHVAALMESVRRMRKIVAQPQAEYGESAPGGLRREELRLICFEFLSGG